MYAELKVKRIMAGAFATIFAMGSVVLFAQALSSAKNGVRWFDFGTSLLTCVGCLMWRRLHIVIDGTLRLLHKHHVSKITNKQLEEEIGQFGAPIYTLFIGAKIPNPKGFRDAIATFEGDNGNKVFLLVDYLDVKNSTS